MKNDHTKNIDRYLLGEMSETEKIKFEQELENNTELKTELKLQKSIYEAAQRQSFRNSVKKVAKTYHFTQWMKWIGLSLVVIGAITTALMLSFENEGSVDKDNLKIEEELTSDAPGLIENLVKQEFLWEGEDTLFISNEGVLVSVPENTLLKNGQPFTGSAIIEWQEALDGASIMKAGLSTMADSNLLETQGMFSLRITDTEGGLLEVDPTVGVYVQAPVDEYKAGMQLYDGEFDNDSIINWVYPVPLEKIPVPVPMSKLDFYPEGYENTLDELKLRQDKKFRDSLYLACEPVIESSSASIVPELNEVISKVDTTSFDDGYYELEMAMEVEESYLYISPSKVLSFWNSKFDNTLLATREFERRMQSLHASCKEELLDLYIKNINQPLWFTDSLIMAKGHQEFENYFAERVGEMDIDNAHLKGLKKFYESEIEKLRNRMKKEREAELEEERAWDKNVSDERQKEAIRKTSREAQAYSEEVDLNHKRSSRQLGFTQGFTLTSNVRIVNIDREVYQATRERKTTNVEFEGKSSTIQYNDFSFTIENHKTYERLYAYLLPDKLNSYQRFSDKNGVFDYPLNNEITYDVVVLGINETGYFYHEMLQIIGGEKGKIPLKQISETAFENRVKELNKSRLDSPVQIADELNWLKLERENYKVQRQREEKRKFLNRIKRVVFPCFVEEAVNEGIQEEAFAL